ncbi:MAG: hypothetical protein RIS63_33 [Bacteroidota bacterium]
MFLSQHIAQDWRNKMSNENDEFMSEESPEERQDLMGFLSEFLISAKDTEMRYRDNYCDIVVNKVFNDFGYEGLCHLMMSIDKKANWISDIIIENSDLDDVMFKKYGFYDAGICDKARQTKAMLELNTKIWRLRRKYAKIIVDEITINTKNTSI